MNESERRRRAAVSFLSKVSVSLPHRQQSEASVDSEPASPEPAKVVRRKYAFSLCRAAPSALVALSCILPFIPKATVDRAKAQSYAHLLTTEPDVQNAPLDLPDTTAASKTVFPLAGMLTTVVPFARPSHLKQIANDRFHAQHPQIGIKLSMLRALKAKIAAVCNDNDLEISSAAIAFVYLEKLCIAGVVSRQNRRVIGAACLLLACKVNEPKGLCFQLLIDIICKSLNVSDVCEAEFFVFSELGFNLFVPNSDVQPHFDAIFKSKNSSGLPWNGLAA